MRPCEFIAGLDSPASRSASLFIVKNNEGSEGAVNWFNKVGFDMMNLDPDGKHFLLSLLFELGHWEYAYDSIKTISNDDTEYTPVLHHMIALTHLVRAVPEELRSRVINQVPFESAGFPLSSDMEAIESRRLAHRHFLEAAKVARSLKCPKAGEIDDEYAIWLELKDPDQYAEGKKRLEEKFREPQSALRIVHHGLQFGVKLDTEAIELEIERQIALNGDLTPDAAIARFALAFSKKTPADFVNYLDQHRDHLFRYLDKKSILIVQIEMLSRAGMPDRAKECLDLLKKEGLLQEEENRIRRLIAEAEGSNPLELRREQYKKTGALVDLINLVDELEVQEPCVDLANYSEVLFEKTRYLRDAERFAMALSNIHENKRLFSFLKKNAKLLNQSGSLQRLYCWALYQEGYLLEARSEMEKLNDNSDDPNLRALKINLGISMGDWNTLSALVAKDCLEKEKRSAPELMQAAGLALNLGSSTAKELIFAAARKGKNDAGILANAYFLASNAGIENNSEVSQWLQDASALSGDDGPIQRFSLKDVLDMKPEWDRRESETWGQLSRGDVPITLAAKSLRKSLVGLTLFPALLNLSERDPRRRGAIPAYSGVRSTRNLNNIKIVGIEATALVTFGFLNIIDKALDSFDTVFIPHSTLAWLFEEKQKVAFHQPSRIRKAHHIRNLLLTNEIEKLLPKTAPTSDLSAQVGEELATLIAEAEKARNEGEIQHIVIRPSPVHRISSLMEEEADLAAYEDLLSSCQALVEKLRQLGQITSKEEKKARAYLQLQEKTWPKQPKINDGAVIYLDDLAVSYFLHLGLLERLRGAGFRPIISQSKVSEANELISYKGISKKVDEVLERIRHELNLRIVSGKIKVGSITVSGLPERISTIKDPTFEIIALANNCDAIIVDDRFINQHANLDNGYGPKPVLTSLDILDNLFSTGSISFHERLEYRTLLRKAGYIFISLDEEELVHHLEESQVQSGKIIETAELKAIRQNLLQVRMSTWLQLPKEAFWLNAVNKTYVRMLKVFWKDNADIEKVRAFSEWLFDQIDIRGWAHRLGMVQGENILKFDYAANILLLIFPPAKVPSKNNDEYWSWLEEKVLASIKEENYSLYSWILDCVKKNIVAMVDIDAKKGLTNGE